MLRLQIILLSTMVHIGRLDIFSTFFIFKQCIYIDNDKCPKIYSKIIIFALYTITLLYKVHISDI